MDMGDVEAGKGKRGSHHDISEQHPHVDGDKPPRLGVSGSMLHVGAARRSSGQGAASHQEAQSRCQTNPYFARLPWKMMTWQGPALSPPRRLVHPLCPSLPPPLSSGLN